MRLYVPAVLADLAAASIGPRPASAVTPALRALLPEEDEEGLELSAFLSAADLSVLALADDAGPRRRVVLALEVPDGLVLAPVLRDHTDLPSLVGQLPEQPWSVLVSIHADEPEAAAAVTAALTDDDAFDALGDVDLLWFDPSERSALVAELG